MSFLTVTVRFLVIVSPNKPLTEYFKVYTPDLFISTFPETLMSSSFPAPSLAVTPDNGSNFPTDLLTVTLLIPLITGSVTVTFRETLNRLPDVSVAIYVNSYTPGNGVSTTPNT